MDPFTAITLGTVAASAISGYATNKNNQKASEAWGNYNAQQAALQGYHTSEQIKALGFINAGLARTAGAAESAAVQAEAAFNAALKKQIGYYRASLLENEVTNIWNALGLDLVYLENDTKQLKGSAMTYYAAAGVDPNEGSPVEAYIDIEAQKMLEESVLRNNAHVAIGEVRNAQAQHIWNGEAEAAAIASRATTQSALATMRGELSGLGYLAQSAFDADMALYSGGVRSSQTSSAASHQAGQFGAAATNSITDGIFKAASVGATMWEKGMFSTSPSPARTKPSTSYPAPSLLPSSPSSNYGVTLLG
jgi:hypothetical protein